MLLVMETDAAKLLPKEVRRGLILSSLLCGRVRRGNGIRLAQLGTGATRVGCCVRDSRSQRSGGMARIVREHSLSCHGRHLASNRIRTRLATSPHRRPDLVRVLGTSLMSVSFRPMVVHVNIPCTTFHHPATLEKQVAVLIARVL